MSGIFSKTYFNAQEAQNNLNTVFADYPQVNELITSISALDQTKNKYPVNPRDYATYIVSEFLSCTSSNQKGQFTNHNSRAFFLKNITSETKEILFKFAQDNLNDFKLSQDPHLEMLSGAFYQTGMGVEGNPEEVVRLYGLAARKGCAIAQNNLGNCHLQGVGTPQNPQEAVRLYGLAARQGNANAQFNLGNCHSKGVGTPKNPEAAVRLYGLAARQGFANAQLNLGNSHANGEGTPKNPEEAVRLYRLAAEQGSANAQTNLGLCHTNGSGTPRNPEEAVRLYGLAAEQGYAIAQYHLGVCHASGSGTPENQNEAVRLYGLAAKQGHSDAQLTLGVIYLYGIHGIDEVNVEADHAKSAMFLQLSRQDLHGSPLQVFIACGWTELMTHSYNGDVKKVKELIEQEIDVNKEFTDEKGNKRTALSLAADAEHGETVNELITVVAHLQKRNLGPETEPDWINFQTQLENPKVQNLLTRETTLMLASILPLPIPQDTNLENQAPLPEAPLNLKNTIINNFNNRNTDKPINEEELIQISDIHSLKEQEFNRLRKSGLSASEANSQIIQESMLLLNPSKQKHFSELSEKLISLSRDFVVNWKDVNEAGAEFDEADLDILLKPDSFRSNLLSLQLSKSIIDGRKVSPTPAGKIPSLETLATKGAAKVLMKDVKNAYLNESPNNTTTVSETSNLEQDTHRGLGGMRITP